jgi:molecular chaperone GrpE
MSEFAPPGVAGSAAGDGQEALTPEAIEAVLADFRTWLQQVAAAPAPPVPAATEAIDLHTLLAQFVALRHEINLQTKSTRLQQEQNAVTLEQFGQALEMLQRQKLAAAEAEQQVQDDARRPLLKTLVDVYDALARGEREVERVREAVANPLPALAETTPAPAEPGPDSTTWQRLSFWSKWLGGKREDTAHVAHTNEKPPDLLEHTRQAAGKAGQLLESVLTGYIMSVQRLERALDQAGLEPIRCVGHAFDPEKMEVVAVVNDSGRPNGEVIEEVRRGYFWRGRLFRYAQVSVAKTQRLSEKGTGLLDSL